MSEKYDPSVLRIKPDPEFVERLRKGQMRCHLPPVYVPPGGDLADYIPDVTEAEILAAYHGEPVEEREDSMEDGKKRELLTIVDTVLMPQLLACKVTLDYLERELDGDSYAFDKEAGGGVDSMVEAFGPNGWVRRSIAELGERG